jgi:hypothetical protein
VPGRRWSPLGPKLYCALPIAPFVVGCVAGAILDWDPVYALLAVPLAVAVWRCAGIALVLEADHAVVRNALWTYRVPYGSILRINEEPLTVLGSDAHPFLGTTRLAIAHEDGGVTVEATGWLPASERAALRKTILKRARDRRRVETSAPYPAVLRILERLDPHPALAEGAVAGYADAAAELADFLREAPLEPDEVADILEIDDAGELTERLNRLS